jgi:predicted MPP superfamily phosphohydrolase
MKQLKFYLIIVLSLLAASCSKDLVTDQPDQTITNGMNLKSANAPLKIAVMSDLHYLHPSLMKNNAESGEAFQTYLMYDPKLIEFSEPILKKAIAEITAAKPDILLIPGDLTKDGEKVGHEAMAQMLKEIADNGIKVFVIPGNHDILNPEAVAYDGNTATGVASVTASEFAANYNDFGYKDALYRDANSLSYVSQPYDNLWILGIDDCKYYLNTDIAIVAGIIKPETMSWIQERLAEAKTKNITVLAMMHHGIMEHYAGQETIDPGYVTDNWKVNADLLIDAGLKVMFTGHYHATDISVRMKEGKELYDIETGSLVTPPSPYRIIKLDPNYMKLNVDTKHITSIDAAFPKRKDFLAYSKMFLSGHLDGIFAYQLTTRFGVSGELSATLAPYYRDAMMAHYAGDEVITPEAIAALQELATIDPSLTLAGILQTFWTDLPTKDINFTIVLGEKSK